VIIIVATSCQSMSKDESDKALMETALKICQDNIILDSHIDWPESVYNNPRDISKRSNTGDFDLERANEGGLNSVLSVIYIPSGLNFQEGRKMYDSLFSIITGYTANYPDKFAMAFNPEDIRDNFNNKLFSIPLCLENGLPIGNDLEYLKKLKLDGITYITLNHYKSNQISDSNFDSNRPWKGLSPFGIEVIKEMNRLGIMIDISHSTDSTVFQVLQNSKAPISATHSSCRHFTPGYERNLSDTLIKSIAEKNGVVMIALGSMFIDSTCSQNINYLLHWFDSTGIDRRSQEGLEYIQTYMQTNKILADSSQVVDHIDHVVEIAGIDHVGFGTDYDGVGPTQPLGLPDVSSYPVIVFELLKRGYTEENINKILSGNFLRVWNDVIEIGDSLNITGT
jgi:membrane dipeptidase